MQTYTLEELNKGQKTRLDYEQEHRKMLAALKESSPTIDEDKENALWDGLPYPFWVDNNLSNDEIPSVTQVGASNFGNTGIGVVPKIEGQE